MEKYNDQELKTKTNKELIDIINYYANLAENKSKEIQDKCTECITKESDVNILLEKIEHDTTKLNEYNLIVDRITFLTKSINNDLQLLEEIEQRYANSLWILNERFTSPSSSSTSNI